MNESERMAADLAVRWLIARYAQLVDDRQIRQCTDELFAPDAAIVLDGKPFSGHAGILGWFEGLSKSPPGKHVTVNAAIEVVDATHARSSSDFVFVKNNTGAWGIVAGGRYVDTCERRGGRWLFVRREITMG